MDTTIIRESVFESINNIDTAVQESNIDVMLSLIGNIEKEAMILENYNGEDASLFAIFQEANVQEADAVASKSENIFVKLWNFIKNIFKSIGNTIKKLWTGVDTTIHPHKASNKLEEIFEKCKDKTPEWIKENAKEIGIASASALSIILSVVAYTNKDAIATAIKEWWDVMVKTFKNMKVLPKLDLTFNGIETNISFLHIFDFVKVIVEMFKMARELAKKGVDLSDPSTLDKFREKEKAAINEGNQIVGEEIKLVGSAEVVDAFGKIINAFVDEDGTNLPAIVNAEDSKDPEKAKANASVISKILGTFAAPFVALAKFVKTIFEKIKGFFKKAEEADQALQNEGETTSADVQSENDANADETTSTADTDVQGENDANAALPLSDDNTDTQGENDSNVELPEIGKEYSFDEVKQYMDKIMPDNSYKVKPRLGISAKNPDGTTRTIRNFIDVTIDKRGGDDKKHGFHRKSDKSGYIYESFTEEELNGILIEESFEETVEVGNYYYN